MLCRQGNNIKSKQFNRLSLSTAIAAALLSGYGSRQVYAGSCTGVAGTYSCSGAANNAIDITQTLNSGGNPLTVTTTSGFGIDTSGTGGDALDLRTMGSSLIFNDLFSSTITGLNSGIYANNMGTGETRITTTGGVTGTNHFGIQTYNAGSTTALTITSVDISGQTGVLAVNAGTGQIRITSTGRIRGTDDEGVYAITLGNGLNISTNVVRGNGGIFAINFGSGKTSVNNTGIVRGGNGFGIVGANFGGFYGSGVTTDLTITANSINSRNTGIYALNFGSGVTRITTTGRVTSRRESGIEVYNGRNAGDLFITTNSVSGGRRGDGISVLNAGTGKTTITVNGVVRGGNRGVGINTRSRNGNADTIINLNSGASVSGGSGRAIVNDEGDSTINVNSGASVIGRIRLGAGRDSINFNGGDFSRVTLFNGGAGRNDSLNFAGSSGRFNQRLMRNIERVTVDNGSTIRFSGNALNVNSLTIQNGGMVNAPNGFAPMGNLINRSGVLSLQNGIVGDNVNVGRNYTGGGQLLLDVDFATNTADKLNIARNVRAGGTQVRINDRSTGYATGAGITVATVGGTTNPGDFILANPTVKGAFNYNTIGLVGQNWQLQSRNPATGGPAYTPIAGSFEAISQSLITLENLPSFAERNRSRLGGANSGDGLGIDTPIWMRMVGGNREIDSDSSSTGADLDTDHWRAQLGVDFIVADNSNGQLSFGINGSYSQADTDIDSRGGNSNIDSEGYSIGLSTTWHSVQGYYIDLQAQKSWYESDFSAGGAGAGHINNVDSDGHSASVEIGQAFNLSNSLEITPHAQLVYAKIDTDKFIGANAEIVRLSKGKSLKARFGANLNKQFSQDGGTHGYLLANVIHEFEDETETKVSGLTLTNSVDQWSAEAGAGISHQWDQGDIQYKLNAEVTGSSSLNNIGETSSIQGGVGFKVNF